jgi:hypothetical protein
MEDDLYEIRGTFTVKIKKWRIKDPKLQKKPTFCIQIYDDSVDNWRTCSSNGLDKPGEEAFITKIEVIN